MLSVIRKSLKLTGKAELTGFKDFDFYFKHPLKRLIQISSCAQYCDGSIQVNIKWHNPPDFKRKFSDGYILGFICFCVDFDASAIESEIQWSENIKLNAPTREYQFTFKGDLINKQLLICLKLHPTEQGIPYLSTAASGMKCIWGGKLRQ